MMTMTTTQTACAMRTVMTTKSKAVRRASVARRAGEQDGQMNQQMEGGCVALRFCVARCARCATRASCAVRGARNNCFTSMSIARETSGMDIGDVVVEDLAVARERVD